MDDDDVVTAVLGQLQMQHGVEAFTAAACVSRQFARLAALDLFWTELCTRRWAAYPEAAHYRAEAEAAIAAARARAAAAAEDAPPPSGAAAAEAPPPSGGAASWRQAYFQREAELERDYPCFCMPAHLRLAEPIGIHFFEPRYRRLIALAMRGDRRFLWAAGRLAVGQRLYLCEAHNVRTYPDGRADLHVLPVLECAVRRAWSQRVGGGVPQLQWARVRLLPTASAAHALRLGAALAGIMGVA